jgi:TonB family protein
MQAPRYVLLFAICSVQLTAEDAPRVGYVDCSSGDKNRPTPVFSNPCVSQPVASLSCGETVKVLSREGTWLKVASTDGGERYIGATAVSQRKDRFVALDLPVSSGPYIQDCSAFRPKTGKLTAVAIYKPDPEYTKQARKSGIQGTVTLASTVGADGRSHDITVLKPLGHGLDEKAVEAVQSWKWEPALDDGKPIESKIDVDVSFRVIK